MQLQTFRGTSAAIKMQCPQFRRSFSWKSKGDFFGIFEDPLCFHSLCCAIVKKGSFGVHKIPTKGQLISKAIYSLLTSPKKRMDEFVLFASFHSTANKSNSSVHLENLRLANLPFDLI